MAAFETVTIDIIGTVSCRIDLSIIMESLPFPMYLMVLGCIELLVIVTVLVSGEPLPHRFDANDEVNVQLCSNQSQPPHVCSHDV